MFAFVFESVGSGEWLVLLAVILIVVGPKNLPSAARKMGQIMSKLRRAADEFKRQLMTMDEEMKKTADEIKHEYIDVPEDGGDRAAHETSAAAGSDDDPGYDYPEDYESMGDYPEGYPEDEDSCEAPAARESEPPSAPEATYTIKVSAAPAPETPETTNGQDTRNS